ncbi:MAG: cellulase family glycosylhydrolase [Lachnospiraceae bacterium]|nr:cellulase family glycosylhydrolase [Lachnospiraceae bacterium]
MKRSIVTLLFAAMLVMLSGCGGIDYEQYKIKEDEAVELDPAEDGASVTSATQPSEGAAATATPGTAPSATEAPSPTATPTPTAGITPTPTTGAAATPTAAVSASGTPFEQHGALHYEGPLLKDKNGRNFQIKGVSTHGIGWFPQYVNAATFKSLRDEWGANCIRLAMYTGEGAGYCTGGNKNDLKKLITNGVQYATDLGMYVIIDWHILSDNDPNTYKDEAKLFFDEMSKKYASYDNVLYEICNEPNGGTSWDRIKQYANEVIPVIRANAKNAIIIVGTPTWSQDVDTASKNPLKGYDNIAYTIHFYAGTHGAGLRSKMQTCLNAGIPVFCSEFGTCDASGNGGNNFNEANQWIKAMDNAGVSYCIWNLSNKNESSALIASNCNKLSGWSEAELSEEGRWYVGVLGGKVPVQASSGSSDPAPTAASGGNTPTQAPAVSGSSGNIKASLSAANSWSDGSRNHCQYTLTVKNSGNATVRGWKIRISFSSDIALEQSWNGDYQASGKSILVTPVDFNNEIPAGGSVEVGFIVSCSGDLGTPKVTVE